MIGVSALEAVRECAKMGRVVLPYIDADPVLARHCEDAGAAADDPVSMAKAFELAVRYAELAIKANGQEVVYKNWDNRI